MADDSKPLTSGRARRAIKIGGLASQVGSSYLWTSLRKPFLNADSHRRELLDTHIRNARRIVESSKQLRGAFMKIVQMLSMRDDLLPAEAIDAAASAEVQVMRGAVAAIEGWAGPCDADIGRRPVRRMSTAL